MVYVATLDAHCYSVSLIGKEIKRVDGGCRIKVGFIGRKTVRALTFVSVLFAAVLNLNDVIRFGGSATHEMK